MIPQRLDPELVERKGRSWAGGWAIAVTVALLAGAVWLVAARGVVPLPEDIAPRGAPGSLTVPESAVLAGLLALAAFVLSGLVRSKAGEARVLVRFGRYLGTVRRTGLVWISPFVRRVPVTVRLNHWRSDPMAVTDADGTGLCAVVLVVWRIKDTARVAFLVDDHRDFLRTQVEATVARTVARLPADTFARSGDDVTESLRDLDAVSDALLSTLAGACRPVGLEVFAAHLVRLEYAPEVAKAMHRRQVAAIDARHREYVLASVLDAVDDTVHRLAERGIAELDDYDRKALVKELTVAFYTARGGSAEAH
ncbi:SPFH domain-containing protein [Streptomyces sp. NPDC050504]|uniref:SPFH domain-containing protein n=1 Tax=Streptomyces sp. NPDC050504 TaxID=3365618 RepID=UPI00379CBFDD